MFRKLTVGTALMTGFLVLAWSLPADAQRRGGQSGGGQGRTQSGHPTTGKAVPRTSSSGGGDQGRTSSGSWSGDPDRRPGNGPYGSRYDRNYRRVYLGTNWYGGPGWYGYGYPAFWGLGWGWGWGWGWWGWPGYSPYPYYGGWGYPTASVRIQVQPKTAEVYVDGNMAGIVDDFDGIFQRLDVEPGGHEITIYKEGFRSFRERLYLTANKGASIKEALEPLAPGEPNEPRPLPTAPPPGYQTQPDPRAPQGWAPRAVPPQRDPQEYQPAPPPEAREVAPAGFGQVSIRVQPTDAEVFIDDEPWRGPQAADRLTVHLRPGPHRVEIKKDGFDPFVTTVEIKNGETTVLNVSLGRLSGV